MTATQKLFAWLAHVYTAMGLVAAAGIAVLIVRGGDRSFRQAFILMMVATAIDATDGWLARTARVKEVLPGFDGRALDDLIDFHTYASLPLLLLWRAGVLPDGLAWLLLLPLLSSAYGFSQVHAKTEDGFFLGFPSYWNVVAFYLYVLHAPVWVSVTMIVTCAVLTFVPTPYLYATRGGPFAMLINVGAAIWYVLLGWVLLGRAGDSRTLAVVSLVYPLMYLALSAAVTVRGRAHSAPRVGVLVLLLLAGTAASGCLVVSLQPAYDAESVVFDEALVGVWDDDGDGYKAIIERGEWRSYKVTFTDRFSTRSFQGNLTKLAGTSCLDVTEMRGTDPGPYLVPVHGIVRLTLAGDTLTAALLDYDWFKRAMTARSLGRLTAAMDDRRNVVVTAPTSELRRWLMRVPTGAFESPSTFTREP
jgi:phosphatidylcholine synthase